MYGDMKGHQVNRGKALYRYSHSLRSTGKRFEKFERAIPKSVDDFRKNAGANERLVGWNMEEGSGIGITLRYSRRGYMDRS